MCARERACLAVPAPRCLSLLDSLFFCHVSETDKRETREGTQKNEERPKRERERERERTDPLCEPFAFWNLPATEIDFLLLGRSASLEIFFFFQRPPGREEEKPFSTPPLETFALSLGSASLFPPALNLWFFCLLLERANFPDPFILNNFYQHFYPRVKYKNVHDDCEPTSCGCGDERYARKRANFQIFSLSHKNCE